MNLTQIINAAAKELKEFQLEDRSLENAKIELLKLIETNSDLGANLDVRQNITWCSKIVINKCNQFL